MILLVSFVLAQDGAVPEGSAPEAPPPIPDPEWCLEAGHLSDRDEAWCSAPPPSCPGFAEACERFRNDSRASEKRRAAEAAEREAAGRSSRWSWPRPSWTLPSAPTGGTFDVGLGWLVLGVVIFAIFAALVSRYFDRDPAEDAEVPRDATVGDEGGAPTVGVTLGSGWLAAAQRARDAGRFVEALLIARGAVVAHFEEAGRIAVDPGRTDRELVRGFVDESETHGGLRTLVSAIEKARYAGAPLAREAVDLALRAAAKLTGVAVLLCVLAPAAWAGAGGRELLPKVLERRGGVVHQAAALAPEPGLQVWLVDDWASDAEVDELLHAVDSGAIVYAFGTGLVDKLEAAGIKDGGEADGVFVYTEYLDEDEGVLPGFTLSLPTAGHHLEGGRPVGWYDAGRRPVAVALDRGAGRLVVIANDWIVDDAAMIRPEHAVEVGELLAVGAGTEITIVSRDTTPPSALHQLLEAGFGVAFLQLALLWLLWAAHKGRAFAPRRPFVETPPREFALHIRAVARFYRAAGASRVGFAASSARALTRLRSLTGAGELAGDALADHAAARLGQDPFFVRNLVARAEAAVADPRGPSSPDEPWLTEALWTLVKRPTPSTR